ncbi:MAG: glutamate--tRNA ligase [Sedimentisphaerales bacterium]|nr:glutamate--tRNA ligase [Sedimentisphaerales bacterium]
MSSTVVTRFAPSPTGYLHIGGARTALFNWLFARHTGGKFLLRIEDTDLKRNTPTATQQVIDDLRWLGIQWDEGPEVGGPSAPYFQSQRLDIYNKYIAQLLESGKAYYTFDTTEELTAMREEAATAKTSLIYRRPKDLPDAKDLAHARAEGKPVTVRFAIPQDEPILIKDVIRGEVKFDPREIGDFIIQKSDGFPTYNFACVIDDELMGVTHVLRGQEHLMNTPGQQALQKALGFRTPVYAHMSVTVSEGGGKLSKREQPKALRNAIKRHQGLDHAKLAQVGGISDAEFKSFLDGETMPDMPAIDAMAQHLGIVLPEINVVDFFKNGYLPEAMVNFIALLGWRPDGEKEIMPLDELIREFTIEKLGKTNSLFDRQKLISFNTDYISKATPGRLLKLFKEFLAVNQSPVAKGDDALLARLIKVNVGARTLTQIEEKCRFIFTADEDIQYDESAVQKVLLKNDGLAMLKIVRDRLAALNPITHENIEQMIRTLAEEKQLALGKVAQPLRVALCGNTISPPIFDSVDILGKERTLRRIDITLKRFERA